MTKAILFFLFLLSGGPFVCAQFQESFNDGDFTNDPQWIGNTDQFVVTQGMLQLNNPTASGTSASYLSTSAITSLEDATVWRFSVRLDFDPSATNQLRVYLGADRPQLQLSEKAYYLQIGESGSNDALQLFLQDQDQTLLLGKGTAGAAANAPVRISIEVRRDQAGQWTVLADYSGGQNLVKEFSVTDSTFSVLDYFGFWCQYSSTRSDAFFFDDIFIDPLFVDHTPPSVVNVSAPSAELVIVNFDEPLDSASAVNAAHYFINNGIGEPEKVLFDPSEPTRVILNLTSNLRSAQEYSLSVEGVMDRSQNTIADQTTTFIFYDIQAVEPGDIIVSEILADPSPSMGLPEAEFFELYNRSAKVLQLNDLFINSGSTPQPLPDYLLLPGAYVAICDDDDLDAFLALGPAVGVRRLPSLSNADHIEITDVANNLLFALSYEETWYGPAPLPDGGISLEIILTDGPADCPGNWTASKSDIGGTPGSENSAAHIPPENIAPTLKNIQVESDFEIRISFSESMNQASVLNVSAYHFTPHLELSELIPGPDNQIILLLANPLEPGRSYELSLNPSIADCMGNVMGEEPSFVIGLPEEALPGDLQLSEILFNPQAGGQDFIELYNRSNKVLNLKGWIFENAFKTSGNTSKIFENNFLVFPGEYVAISSDPGDILRRYSVPSPPKLVENALPTLEDKAGNMTIRRPDSLVIDAFDYEADFHFSLLKNTRGISLERLSFDQATQSRGNWHSAAESAGFATPTGVNSQTIITSTNPNLVFIDQPRFSPDNDGFEDVLLIHLNPDRIGYVANIKIFDAQGRLVRDLVKNRLLGHAEPIKWDGITNEKSKARMGPYVVWIELFEPRGAVITEKKTIVVAGKL